MTFALLGVFVMQMYYIRESYNLKSQLFEQNVNQALTAVVNKIQKKNVISRINRKDDEFKALEVSNIRSKTDSIVAFKERYKENKMRRRLKQQQQILQYLNEQDSIIHSNYLQPQIISEEDYAILSNPNPNNNTLTYNINETRSSKDGKVLSMQLSSNFTKRRPVIKLDKLPDSIIYLAINPSDLRPQFIILPTIDPDTKVKYKIEDAKAEHSYRIELERLYADTVNLFANGRDVMLLQDVAKEMANKDVPLEDRMPSQETVDTLIKKELLSKNIDLDYQYWVTPSKSTGKIIYQNVSQTIGNVLPKNTFSKVIFSNNLMIKDPGMLYVSFPNKNSLIFNTMFAMLASSVGLLLVLVSIFAYTIYAIIRQKKLSEMKTDFINNMTHEFKTPVATIMIASEALKDPDLTPDKARVNRLAGIIYDENVRLGNHIERVLSVAKLDKKELKLERKPVAMNELISLVVDSMSLQLQKKDAEISLDLIASPDVVIGDELHLSNLVYNLIDNANKYSPVKPIIAIKTKNYANGVCVEVSDKGIGMTKEQTKRIFDQFYRVPTGNLHDVKGFGLGLSYVHDIIEQMNGTIKVNSEKDNGTTFLIYLPFKLSN
ncbi:MAG: HAMP domain-containing sensor histidine kinase [Pedobacter sp.]|uniref:sensor histidine kinase n=1 Tax=Pedobacter sp. TaxID=1411316 RepID=UPI0028072E9C|nr:HAMP domain-containing sensor histidine kinase [Pedobacter sp.]MDQ8004421.1 HAMP domain-containing sensor histidine kinase [Pedobacter sp.]